MKIIDKIKQKIKDDERFISKMILTGVLSVSIPAIAGGVFTCNKAVKNNPNNFTEDNRYIAGIISITAGTTLLSAGVAGSIDNKKDDDESKCLPFYDEKHGTIRMIEKPENIPDGKPSMSGPVVDPRLFNGEQKNNKFEEQENENTL